jgi:hypothetical protein
MKTYCTTMLFGLWLLSQTLGFAYHGAENIYNFAGMTGQQAGNLSVNRCERERLLRLLKSYATSPEGIADVTFFIEPILGAKALGELSEGLAASQKTEQILTQSEFSFTEGNLSGKLTEWTTERGLPKDLHAFGNKHTLQPIRRYFPPEV